MDHCRLHGSPTRTRHGNLLPRFLLLEWVPEDVRGSGSRGLQRLDIQPVRNERAEHPRRTINFVNTYRPCKSTVQPVDPTARAREIAADSHMQWTTDADAFRLERFQRISCLDPSVHGVWAHICEMCKKATVDLARDVCRFAILDVLVTLLHKQQDIRATAQLLPRGGERLAQLAGWPVQSLGPVVTAHTEASTVRSRQCLRRSPQLLAPLHTGVYLLPLRYHGKEHLSSDQAWAAKKLAALAPVLHMGARAIGEFARQALLRNLRLCDRRQLTKH